MEWQKCLGHEEGSLLIVECDPEPQAQLFHPSQQSRYTSESKAENRRSVAPPSPTEWADQRERGATQVSHLAQERGGSAYPHSSHRPPEVCVSVRGRHESRGHGAAPWGQTTVTRQPAKSSEKSHTTKQPTRMGSRGAPQHKRREVESVEPCCERNVECRSDPEEGIVPLPQLGHRGSKTRIPRPRTQGEKSKHVWHPQ